MTSADSITSLIETYRKFGWEPRRLMLTAAAKTALHPLPDDLPTTIADIDAVWFSRPRQLGETPWELRHLGISPFSILEHLDEDSPEFEFRLSEIEHRMAESVAARKDA